MDIKSNASHLWKKWRILYLSIPFYAYALATTLNNAFGIDMLNGAFGEREPVGAGYTLMLFTPFYLGAIVKSLYDFFIRRPAFISIDDFGVKSLSYPKAMIESSGIESVSMVNAAQAIAVRGRDSKGLDIPLNLIEASPEDVTQAFKKYGWIVQS